MSALETVGALCALLALSWWIGGLAIAWSRNRRARKP